MDFRDVISLVVIVGRPLTELLLFVFTDAFRVSLKFLLSSLLHAVLSVLDPVFM